MNTVIFDMDGLLIDSEPCWQEAGIDTLRRFDVALTLDQYHQTTGLRTAEWVAHWFDHFHIDRQFAKETEKSVLENAIERIYETALPLPGVDFIFSFFKERNFKIGLATSSPPALIEVVVKKLNIGMFLDAIASADLLQYGKPHPQVYLDCAGLLDANPVHCICFEDSFNGMIAVKAARMKCVIIPAHDQYPLEKWSAADIKIATLNDFNATML